jgi:ATP-dependent RNA helicase CshB
METLDSLLLKLKFNTLTPIQEKVKVFFNTSKKNIVGIAPTGTGKTHAYLIPIYFKIKQDLLLPQVIILLPTNELVDQTYRFTKELDPKLVVKAFNGRSNMDRELYHLTQTKAHIIITTPIRLKKISDAISLKNVKYLVLDEADMLFQYDFLADIDKLLGVIKDVRIMMFSATMNKAMDPFIKKYFGDYQNINTYVAHTLKITNKLVRIVNKDRLETLKSVLATINPYCALIFVSNSESLESVYNAVKQISKESGMISSSLSLTERKNVVNKILKNEFIYVVGTDLSSRGLDFNISHVINFDLPMDLEYFIHRIGRTGRMGASGETITLYDENDNDKIKKIKEKGIDFVEYSLTKDSSLKKK